MYGIENGIHDLDLQLLVQVSVHFHVFFLLHSCDMATCKYVCEASNVQVLCPYAQFMLQRARLTTFHLHIIISHVALDYALGQATSSCDIRLLHRTTASESTNAFTIYLCLHAVS